MDSVKILNARVLNGTLEDMVELAENAIENKRQIFGTGINLNQLYLLRKNLDFAQAIDNAELCPPDGTPVIWISKWMGCPLKQKVVGPDVTLALCELAAKKHYKVFVLGGKPGSAEKALGNIQKKYGYFDAELYCPSYGFEKKTEETQKLVRLLADSHADILLMALSAPKQEIFVEKYRREIPISVIFGAGIAIDYYAGRIRQAPRWVNRIGLEWFYRLLQEPRRLFKRYIVHDIPTLVFMYRWAKRHRADVEKRIEK